MRKICWRWCTDSDPGLSGPQQRSFESPIQNLKSKIGLSRRPVKRAASQHVDVQVEHGLPRPGAVVDYGAIALRIQSALPRQLSRDKKKVAEQRLVFGEGLLERGEVLARYHQQVDRRLRVNVLDRHGALVLMNDFGGDLAADDSAKEAIHD